MKRFNFLLEPFNHGTKICYTQITIKIPTHTIFHPCDRCFGCDGILHLADISLVCGYGDRGTDRWLFDFADNSTVC